MDGPTSTAAIKAKKRKLDEALHSLDQALNTDADQPSPPKRPRFPGSLYSTLSKYGIKVTKEEQQASVNYDNVLKEKAPRLSAILQRTTEKARKVIPFRPPQISAVSLATTSLASSSEYRPSSLQSFLSRLSTYQLATYSNKPSAIDAVAAAKHGWVNEGKDRLVCGICKNSWVVASKDGMTREAANTLLEQQKAGLKDMHKEGCPWRVQHCDDGIYHVPLKSPTAMAKEVKIKAHTLEESLRGVEIKHPLSTTQLASLMKSIHETKLDSATRLNEDYDSEFGVLPEAQNSTPEQQPSSSSSEPSEAAVLTALLGWSVAPPQPTSTPPSSVSRGTSFSISRAGSPVPSRPSSVLLPTQRAMRMLSATPSIQSISVSSPMPLRPLSYRTISSSVANSRKGKEREKDVLHCELCQRRVGLWTFKNATVATLRSPNPNATPAPRVRPFDLLKEHRPYCPYVVRSTSLPSLPTPTSSPAQQQTESLITNTLPRSSSDSSITFSQITSSPSDRSDLVEGWKAALAVVLRSGLGRRQRVRSVGVIGSQTNGLAHDDVNATSDPDFVDAEGGIHAMVEGVKTKGGRELLRYVKGLFS